MDSIIKDLSLHEFRSFQVGCFYDPIIDWLEESSMMCSIINNKFQQYPNLNTYAWFFRNVFKVFMFMILYIVVSFQFG